MSTRDIAQKYGTAQTNVRRMMKYYGIQTRKPGEKTDYFNNKMKPVWDKYKESNRKHYSKKCEWCGDSFEIDYRTKNKKFCSEKCLKKYWESKQTKYYCEACGKEISYTGRHYKRRFCDKCLPKHRSESQRNRIKTNCGYCNKEIYVIPSKYKANKYCYCDEKCMAKHYAQIYTGENSPTWTGGKHHYTGNWLSARNKARKRDEYTCQICGIHENEYGQELSVHHIKKYKSFENKFEANELKNLVSLCEPCHRFVHSHNNINKIWIKE